MAERTRRVSTCCGGATPSGPAAARAAAKPRSPSAASSKKSSKAAKKAKNSAGTSEGEEWEETLSAGSEWAWEEEQNAMLGSDSDFGKKKSSKKSKSKTSGSSKKKADASDGGTTSASGTGAEASKPPAPAGPSKADAAKAKLKNVDYYGLWERWQVPALFLGGLLATLIQSIILTNVMTPSYVGWTIGFCVLLPLATYLPLKKYFNTFEVDAFVVISSLVALLGLGAYGYVMWQSVFGGSDDPRSWALVFLVFLYPTLVLLSLAVWRLRDNKWKRDGLVHFCLALSFAALVVFAVLVMYAYPSNPIVVGLGILFTGLIVYAILGLALLYFARRRHLPPWAIRASFIIFLLVVAMGVVVGAVSSVFVGFSISWLALAFGAGVYGYANLNSGLATLYGPHVFPVYQFHPKQNKVRGASAGVVYAGGALLMISAWGVAAALWFDPAWAGVLTSVGGIIFFVLLMVDRSRVDDVMMARALPYLNEDKIRQLWLKAVARESDVSRADTVKEFGDDSEEEPYSVIPTASDSGALQESYEDASGSESEGQESAYSRSGSSWVSEAEESESGAGGSAGSTSDASSSAAAAGDTSDASGTASGTASDAATSDAASSGDAAASSAGDTTDASGTGGASADDADAAGVGGASGSKSSKKKKAGKGKNVAVRMLRGQGLVGDYVDETKEAKLAAMRKRYRTPEEAEAARDALLARMAACVTEADWVKAYPEVTPGTIAAAAYGDLLEMDAVVEAVFEGFSRKRAHFQLLAHNSAVSERLVEERALGDVLRSTPEFALVNERAVARWGPDAREWRDLQAACVAHTRAQIAYLEEQAERKRQELEAERRREELARERAREMALLEAERAEREAEEAREREAEAERERAEAEARRAEEEAERQRRLEQEELEAAERKKLEEEQAAAEAERQAEEAARAAEAAERAAEKEARRIELASGKAVIPAMGPGISEISYSGQWSDSDFGHSDGALFTGEAGVAGRVSGWLRVGNFQSRGSITADPTPNDIIQGSLGDCWLLSACAVLAGRRPDLLEALFLRDEVHPSRIFGVKLYKSGLWHNVVVDDYIPRGNSGPAYVHSPGNRKIWPMIIEKAFAKFFGSYSELNGGYVTSALVAMTGGVGSTKTIRAADAESGELWETLVEHNEGGHLLACGSAGGSDTNKGEGNIVLGHAYSILDVIEVDDYKLIKLRNPWGNTEWTGDFSDNSDKWTRRLRAKCNFDGAANDGVFWMEYSDWSRMFEQLNTCRLFGGASWNTMNFVTRWRGDSAGGCGNNKTAKQNPQIALSVSTPTTVVAVLTHDAGADVSASGIKIFKQKKASWLARVDPYQQDALGGSSYTNENERMFEMSLDPGDYVIVPMTFDEGEQGDCFVVVHSDEDIKGRLLDNPFDPPSDGGGAYSSGSSSDS